MSALDAFCVASSPEFPPAFGAPFGGAPPAFADASGDALSVLFGSLLTPGDAGGSFSHGGMTPDTPGGDVTVTEGPGAEPFGGSGVIGVPFGKVVT